MLIYSTSGWKLILTGKLGAGLVEGYNHICSLQKLYYVSVVLLVKKFEAQEDCYFIKASQVVEIEMTEIGIKVDLYS